MASTFDQAFQLSATPQIENWFGVSITFRQDGQTTEPFTAASQQPMSDVVGEKSVLTAKYSRKWTLPAVSLVLGGRTVEPHNGSVIKEAETGQRFQIVSGSDVPKPELQPGGYQWLVYTNRISDA